MSKRLFRLGTWLSCFASLISLWISPLTVLPARADSLAPTTANATQAHVVINELLANASAGSEQFIELYNSGTTAMDLTNWTLSDNSGQQWAATFGLSIPASGFIAIHGPFGINPVADTITLAASGIGQDSISYGSSLAAQIHGSDADRSIGRLNDGSTNWIGNLTPSPATSNVAANPNVVLTAPQSAHVAPTSTNNRDVINLNNQSTTVIEIKPATTALSTDIVTGELIQSQTLLRSYGAFAQVDANGMVQTPPITTVGNPALVDGALAVRAFAQKNNGLYSAYSALSIANRDTIAPPAPTGTPYIAAGNENAAHIINSHNVNNGAVTISLPNGIDTSDSLAVTLANGSTSSVQRFSHLTGGSTMNVTGLDATKITDGQVTISAQIVDWAGNTSTSISSVTATKDTALPVASVSINNGASVTASTTVTVTIQANDIGTGLSGGLSAMRLSNTNDFKTATWEPIVTSKNWPLLAGEGVRTVYIQVMDAAGNISQARNVLSSAEDSILVSSSVQPPVTPTINAGTQTIRQGNVEVTVTATSPSSLTIATFGKNPGTAVPAGLTSVGNFTEVGLADSSKITFPALVKLYYTTADLQTAGVTNEHQLLGIGYFDSASQSWKLYASTGVSSDDIMVNGTQYAGYVYANADHLTPLVALADVQAPTSPAKLTVDTDDQTVTLHWSAVSGANGYVIRYRPIGSTTYATAQVAADANAAKIVNLVNGTDYEFGVATVDTQGNQSAFQTTNATPHVPTPTPTSSATSSPKPTTSTPSAAPSASPSPSSSATSSPSTTPKPSITNSEEQNEATHNQWLVILAIVVIAIGAGTAGYYGYQWLATRPEMAPKATTPVEKTEPTPTPPVAQQSQEEPVVPEAEQPAQPETPPKPVESPPAESTTSPEEPLNTPEPPKGRW